ncbi:MAG: hypothetical protein ABIH78_02565 [Candidatus Peregrinibacteria bacterium]
MPFLIIICVGVIIVLVFNLWKAIFRNEASGDAFMHIVSGNVQMRMWNTDSYFDLSSDALIMEGDEIKTSADARVIVEFFDGTIMRMDGGSDVILQQTNEDASRPEIGLLLVDGKLWFNKLYKDTGDTVLNITMNNIVVKSFVGSIFEVESDFEEVVRVLKVGEVDVDIMNEDSTKVVETENVGLGQEIVFTDDVLEKYWQYNSPSVLSPLSDEFKATAWYSWNDSEDKSPTQFSKAAILGQEEEFVEVAPEIIAPVDDTVSVPETEDVVPEGDSATEPSDSTTEPVAETETSSVGAGQLTTPTISSVAGITEVNDDGYYVVSSKVATLTGSVSGADKVVVSGYTLQKFTPGDGTWTYYANADYGLMDPGENIYEIYAMDSSGNKSATLTVKVLYSPPAAQSAPAAEAETPVADEPVADEETPVADESADGV